MPEIEDHECNLLVQDEDIVKSFIDSGIFIRLRRVFRSICMLNRSHPQSLGYFKSIAACRHEQIRHLLHYYYIIHPFSMLNLFWEFYMFVLFTFQFALIPVVSAFRFRKVNQNIYFSRCIIDALQIMDITKIFFTGYYDHQKSKVILDHTKIAKRYLLTFFFFDIISSLHCYMYPLRNSKVSEHFLEAVRLLNRVKICRMIRWLDILELFRQYMGYSSYLFKGIRVALTFILIAFWAFSVIFFVQNYVAEISVPLSIPDTKVLQEDDVVNEVAKSYHTATLMLLVVSVEKEEIKTIVQFVSATFFLCFGFALQMFLYSQILQVWTKYASAENKHHSLHEQFKEYMKYKELPVTLRERIFSYFEFKFHRQFFKESDINNMVSPILRQEILLHVTRNHIEKVDFFKYLPETILMKVITHLKSEIYLPGDVIVSAGSFGNCMFFIYHGTVAVYTPMGKELCHLEDGEHFGEIALILKETRIASVVAVTACELFVLKRSDFLDTIEPFPEFKEELLALATERLHDTIQQSK